MMGKPISMDQLHQDVGNMVEKITKVIAGFRHLQLKMEEYVCLKVISMVSAEGINYFEKKKFTSSFIVSIFFPNRWSGSGYYLWKVSQLPENIYKKAFSKSTKSRWRSPSQITWGKATNLEISCTCFYNSLFFQVKVAASLLLESKMFYVPFLLNSSID